LGAVCFLIPLVWISSEGLPTFKAILSLVIFTAPVWIWGLLAFSTANRLRHDAGHVAALALLSLGLIVTWVIAWESQMFEPEMRISGGGFLIGIRPPASWNEGRWGFALLALLAALGIASLLASWSRIPSGTRGVFIFGLGLATVVLVASVPVLQAREQARTEHAREACTAFLRSEEPDPTEARSRCLYPYDEPFVRPYR
jgi:hypothetical protein